MTRNMFYINIMIKFERLNTYHQENRFQFEYCALLSSKVANPLSSLCSVVNKKVCHQQSEFVGTLVTDVGVDQTNGDYPF